MISSLRVRLIAAYVAASIFIVYAGTALPSLNSGPAKVLAGALVAAILVALGAVLRTWWACVLAIVPLLVAVPGNDEWPLLAVYVLPSGLLIAAGVIATRRRNPRHH
jgi:hypothetical protein